MQNEKLENLKEKIRKAYQTGDLKTLAECFNIPVDESRIDDYNIADFNYTSLQIFDNKNNIVYSACFNDTPKWYNSNNNGIPFNHTIIVYPEFREEKIYSIGCREPFISRMSFLKDDYELVFKREIDGSNTTMTIQYLKSVDYEGQRVQQELLTKIYGRYLDFEDNLDYDLEQEFTYAPGVHRYVEYKDSSDKYFYNVRNKNIVYGINEYERDNCSYLYGLCAESGDIDFSRFLPLNMRLDEFPSLKEDPKIACVFKCGIDGIHHKLEIFEHNGKIILRHYSNRFNEKGEGYFEIVDNQEFVLKQFYPDHLLSSEILFINDAFENIYKKIDSNFAEVISSELSSFASLFKLREMPLVKYFYKEPISPRLLIDKPFEEIAENVIANSDVYFEKAEEIFRKLANIPEEEPVVKQLTPKK